MRLRIRNRVPREGCENASRRHHYWSEVSQDETTRLDSITKLVTSGTTYRVFVRTSPARGINKRFITPSRGRIRWRFRFAPRVLLLQRRLSPRTSRVFVLVPTSTGTVESILRSIRTTPSISIDTSFPHKPLMHLQKN